MLKVGKGETMKKNFFAEQAAASGCPPLTMDELQMMNDADVWVVYPTSVSGERLIMHALVEFDPESGNVWLTNNLGGRSIFDDVIEDGAAVYRRKEDIPQSGSGSISSL